MKPPFRRTWVVLLSLVACGSPAAPSATLTATTTPTAALTHAATPATEPAWVIQSRSGRIEVFDASGANAYSPTEDVTGLDQMNPDWSPDGGQLTFVVSDGARDDLWVVNVDGSDAEMLYDCADDCDRLDDPAWSPDGLSIAACKLTERDGGHFGTLVAIDVATGAESVLLTHEGLDFCAGARWSPDGSQMVLEIVHRESDQIDMDVSGLTLSIVDFSVDPPSVIALTNPSLFAATADWSRQTGLIVYSAQLTADGGPNDLFTLDHRVDSEPTRLTSLSEGGHSAVEPSFDETGSNVVFVGSSGGLARVWLDSGEIEQAFENPVSGRHPRVRPQ